MGASPPWPPFCPPPWAEGSPEFWAPLVAGLLRWATCPLFLFWGHIPQTPCHGGFAPLDPSFAHPRRLRVRQSSGPHSWPGLLMWATCPLFLFWGHIPQSPCHGGSAPLAPSFAHTRGLSVCQGFGSHSWPGLLMWATCPLFLFWGHIPQTPWEGAQAPSTPSLIKVGAGRPFSKRLISVGVNGAHPPDPLPWGLRPPGPPFCPPPLA
jgi:hypothetical protein